MSQGRVADRPWSRLRGLIGTPSLKPGEGLWITPCNGIHMWFMSCALDIVYLDRNLAVLALDPDMAPWRTGRFVKGGRSVLELPAGTIASTGTSVGDRIALEKT
jgi:uncharacterized membrane protein (UPF0127 family)